jgi:nitrate reductase NapAB chaperone NapD
MSVSVPTHERYLTDSHGDRIAVVLDIEEYETLLDQLDQLDQLDAIQAYDKAKASDDERIPFEEAVEEINKSQS